MFASEHYGVTPDAMALAKGIASGFPLGALLMKQELSAKWSTSAHGGTYTGNPVACAAGSATIKEIKKLLSKLPAKAKALEKGLRSLAKEFPQHIKEVRGLGLMWAVDLGSPEKTKAVRELALKKKILLISCGPNDDALRIIPPLIATSKEFNVLFSTLRSAFLALS